MRAHWIKSELLTELGIVEIQCRLGVSGIVWGEGRRATGEFLDTNADHLDRCSTADLDALLKEC